MNSEFNYVSLSVTLNYIKFICITLYTPTEHVSCDKLITLWIYSPLNSKWEIFGVIEMHLVQDFYQSEGRATDFKRFRIKMSFYNGLFTLDVILGTSAGSKDFFLFHLFTFVEAKTNLSGPVLSL